MEKIQRNGGPVKPNLLKRESIVRSGDVLGGTLVRMQKSFAFCALVVAAMWLSACINGPDTVFNVTVNGNQQNVRQFKVDLNVGGTLKSKQIPAQPSAIALPTSFSIQFDPSLEPPLTLTVTAIDDKNVPIASGSSSTTTFVKGKENAISVSLADLAPTVDADGGVVQQDGGVAQMPDSSVAPMGDAAIVPPIVDGGRRDTAPDTLPAIPSDAMVPPPGSDAGMLVSDAGADALVPVLVDASAADAVAADVLPMALPDADVDAAPAVPADGGADGMVEVDAAADANESDGGVDAAAVDGGDSDAAAADGGAVDAAMDAAEVDGGSDAMSATDGAAMDTAAPMQSDGSVDGASDGASDGAADGGDDAGADGAADSGADADPDGASDAQNDA